MSAVLLGFGSNAPCKGLSAQLELPEKRGSGISQIITDLAQRRSIQVSSPVAPDLTPLPN